MSDEYTFRTLREVVDMTVPPEWAPINVDAYSLETETLNLDASFFWAVHRGIVAGALASRGWSDHIAYEFQEELSDQAKIDLQLVLDGIMIPDEDVLVDFSVPGFFCEFRVKFFSEAFEYGHAGMMSVIEVHALGEGSPPSNYYLRINGV